MKKLELKWLKVCWMLFCTLIILGTPFIVSFRQRSVAQKSSVTTAIHSGRVVSLPVVCNEFKFEKVLFNRLDGLLVIPGQPFLGIFKQQG